MRSFQGLRSRAKTIRLEETQLVVAALSDTIRSKRTAGRLRDLAVLDVLEKTLDEETRLQEGKADRSQERE